MARSKQRHPARSIPRPSFVSTRGDRVHLSAALFGGPAHKSIDLCVGAAYELGRELIDHAEGLLAGVRRPWDDDPGRAPFASRSYGAVRLPVLRTRRGARQRRRRGRRTASRKPHARKPSDPADGLRRVIPPQTREARGGTRTSQPRASLDLARGPRRT